MDDIRTGPAGISSFVVGGCIQTLHIRGVAESIRTLSWKGSIPFMELVKLYPKG
jgi:tetrahydromethanopterin S-methyltransferase subunit A